MVIYKNNKSKIRNEYLSYRINFYIMSNYIQI